MITNAQKGQRVWALNNLDAGDKVLVRELKIIRKLSGGGNDQRVDLRENFYASIGTEVPPVSYGESNAFSLCQVSGSIYYKPVDRDNTDAGVMTTITADTAILGEKRVPRDRDY